MAKPYKPYKTRLEHAAALARGYFAHGNGPQNESEWLQIVALGIDRGRQLAAVQWRRRLKDAEARIENLSGALSGKRS